MIGRPSGLRNRRAIKRLPVRENKREQESETNGYDHCKLYNGSQKTRADSENGQSEDYRVRSTKVSVRISQTWNF
jgi:hypothetical protein